MADTPETVLQTFLKKKFDANKNTKWDLKNKRLHRLVASFIYLRAKALIERQQKSAADAAAEITNELTAVKDVVIDRLGANNRSGALGGGGCGSAPTVAKPAQDEGRRLRSRRDHRDALQEVRLHPCN